MKGNRNKGEDHPRSVPILQKNPNGSLVREWGSMNLVEQELGFNRSHISKCIKEKKLAYGFMWEKIA